MESIRGDMDISLTTAEYGVLGRMSRGIDVIGEGDRDTKYLFENYSSPIQPRTFWSLIKKGMVEHIPDPSLPKWQYRYRISTAGLSMLGEKEVVR